MLQHLPNRSICRLGGGTQFWEAVVGFHLVATRRVQKAMTSLKDGTTAETGVAGASIRLSWAKTTPALQLQAHPQRAVELVGRPLEAKARRPRAPTTSNADAA